MKKIIYITTLALLISCATQNINSDKIIGVYYSKCYQTGLPVSMFELQNNGDLMIINKGYDNDFGKWHLKNDTLILEVNKDTIQYKIKNSHLFLIVKNQEMNGNYLNNCYMHKVKKPFYYKKK